jgi:hypothetical protein
MPVAVLPHYRLTGPWMERAYGVPIHGAGRIGRARGRSEDGLALRRWRSKNS